MTVLDFIGRTRLISLQHIVPAQSARVLLKLEYENPTGSMKDRMALAMIEAAEEDGRLKPGDGVVEYTGGSTGVSLAFVCAAKRIPLQIVTSDAFSKEKRDHMAALGARLTLVASPTGGTTRALTLEMIEKARAHSDQTHIRSPRSIGWPPHLDRSPLAAWALQGCRKNRLLGQECGRLNHAATLVWPRAREVARVPASLFCRVGRQPCGSC